jgi:hypothetical protein
MRVRGYEPLKATVVAVVRTKSVLEKRFSWRMVPPPEMLPTVKLPSSP